MKLAIGLLCLLSVAAFAESQGAGRGGNGGARHSGGGQHGAVRSFGHYRGEGNRLGYGWGGYGYWGGYDYDPGYLAPAVVPSRRTQAPAPDPPAHSVIHEYNSPADYGTESTGPLLYLIAFRDKTIRAAMAYWLQDDSVYYLDTDHKQQHAPLSSVDRDLSAQLNRERHVPFGL